MVDIVIRGARLGPSSDDLKSTLTDIAVDGGRIVAVGPGLDIAGTELRADGRLLVPGLVDTHLHLDKSRVGSGGGGLQEAVAHLAKAKETFSPEAVFERASQTLLACITHGTTHIRTQVELDPTIELRGFEGVLAAVQSFASQVDVQICVFPQEGLTLSPETEDLLIQGLKGGATVIGGAPYTDANPRAQIDLIFDLARQFDVDIDLHLDLAETTEGMQVDYVCAQTEAYGYGGRVTVGHVTQLSLLTPGELVRIGQRLADVGVAVTALPATDLFLMGRSAARAKPRGVAPLAALREHGVTCSVATNNVLNSFTPYGDGSLIRMANLYANVDHVSEPTQLADCLSMITDQAAAILRCDDYGFTVGSPADLVLLDTKDPASAIAEIAPAVWGMKAGRKTFSRPPVVLHQRERTLPWPP